MDFLGLHFDRPFLRIALVRIHRQGAEVRFLKSAPFLGSENVKQLYIADRKGDIATGVSALVRILEFPVRSLKQIEAGLPFQIESATHLPIEELVYSASIKIGDKESEAALFFLPKAQLRENLEEWSRASIEPDFVTSNSISLASFSIHRSQDLGSSFLIHLGSNESLCVWVEKGEVRKSFSLPYGIENLLSALWEDRKKVIFQKEIEGVAKQIDLQHLKTLLNPHLSQKLEDLRKHLATVLYSFQQESGPRPVFFTGRVDAFGRLPEYLIQTSRGLPLFEPPVPISAEEHRCSLAIGHALAAASKKPIQFLKGEFVPRRAWKRAGFWGTILAAASICLSLSITLLAHFQSQNQKMEMANALKKIIDPKHLRSASTKNLDEAIDQAVATIEKHDKEFPYILQAPTVTEFLSWLSHHPQVHSSLHAEDGFEVLDVRYQLLSYPRMGSLREPYKAQVEVEFRVASPMIARKFHESLLQNGDWIDLSEEVSWESLSDSYRTSFTLKNRTPYVP